MAMHTTSTADLLDKAAEITEGADDWTPEQRASFVDDTLASIVEALESRGYRGSWDHWTATGEWDAVREPQRAED